MNKGIDQFRASEANKYESALSRSFEEGGYTFLHRVFRTHFETGEPVIIDSGGLYIQYKYEPEHQTFSEGLTVLQGDNQEALIAFMGVADTFNLDTAFDENGINRPSS